MSTSQVIQDGVKSAFKALGDLVAVRQYNHVTEGAYDDTTGSNSTSTVGYAIGMIRTAYDLEEVDGENIKATDEQFIAEARLFTFSPLTGDTITDGSAVFNIKSISQDPAKATYTFQGRR